MFPRSKGKKKISLENVHSIGDRELRFNSTDLSPLRKVIHQQKTKKRSQSRDSNNGKSVKSRSKHSSRIEELGGRIFKTHNLHLPKEEVMHRKGSYCYYLPANSGMKTAHPRMYPDGLDFDSYLFRLKGKKNKLSLSNAGTDKIRLLAKRKSCEKTPIGRLNITCDLIQTLKCKSRSKSKSSKKSQQPSREDEDMDMLETEKEERIGRQRTLTRSKKKSDRRKPSRKRSVCSFADKLDQLYRSLCDIVEDTNLEADAKLTAISKMFVKYTNLVEKMNARSCEKNLDDKLEVKKLEVSSKILNFFCFYSKMNIESYIYTRSLALKALNGLEEFITKEKDILYHYSPKFFAKSSQITIVEAVDLMKEFASSMIAENKLLTDYIKQHMGDYQVLDMVKKAMNTRDAKPNKIDIELDLKDLRRKIAETSADSKNDQTTNHGKTKKSKALRTSQEIAFSKNKLTYGLMSSSRSSAKSRGLESSNNLPISNMGNSTIMRFRNQEEYDKELETECQWEIIVENKNMELTPMKNKYSEDERAIIDRISTPSRLNRSDSSGDLLGPPSDTKIPVGVSMHVRDSLKNKLKLNLPMVKPAEGFHEEFMKKFDEFSISWRTKILQEKNAKHYNIKQ